MQQVDIHGIAIRTGPAICVKCDHEYGWHILQQVRSKWEFDDCMMPNCGCIQFKEFADNSFWSNLTEQDWDELLEKWREGENWDQLMDDAIARDNK